MIHAPKSSEPVILKDANPGSRKFVLLREVNRGGREALKPPKAIRKAITGGLSIESRHDK